MSIEGLAASKFIRAAASELLAIRPSAGNIDTLSTTGTRNVG